MFCLDFTSMCACPTLGSLKVEPVVPCKCFAELRRYLFSAFDCDHLQMSWSPPLVIPTMATPQNDTHLYLGLGPCCLLTLTVSEQKGLTNVRFFGMHGCHIMRIFKTSLDRPTWRATKASCWSRHGWSVLKVNLPVLVRPSDAAALGDTWPCCAFESSWFALLLLPRVHGWRDTLEGRHSFL